MKAPAYRIPRAPTPPPHGHDYADPAHAHDAPTPATAPALLRLFDITSSLSGSHPTLADGGILIQTGTNIAAGASPLTITFDTPFPGGIISVVACFGDAPGASIFYVDNAGASGFRFNSSAAVGHRVNWIAIGY